MTRARHAPISGEKSPVCDGLPARLELLNNFKAKAQTLISLPQHTHTLTYVEGDVPFANPFPACDDSDRGTNTVHARGMRKPLCNLWWKMVCK